MSSDSKTPLARAWAVIVGLVGVMTASLICCVIPFLLGMMGFTAWWFAYFRWFTPYQIYIAAAGLVLFGFLLWREYKVPKACKPGTLCTIPWWTPTYRILLWIGLIIVLLSLAWKFYPWN